MTDGPRVSIVTPAFNSGSYLEVVIESVLGQTLRDWEMIVSDDGSTDGTADVAQRFADSDGRIRVLRDRNTGVSAARNRGFDATDPRSEFVVFLDHDDEMEPDALAILVAALDGEQRLGSAYGLARSIDSDGRQPDGDDLAAAMRARTAYVDGRRVPLPPEAPTPFEAFVHHNWVVTPGTQLIRRSALERTGLFDPACVPADDWDMALRLSRLSDVAFVDRPVLRWRRHEAALSAQTSRWRVAGHRVRKKMLVDPSNTRDQSRAARWACRDEARALWRQTGDELARLRPRGALRQALKALDSSVRFRWWMATSRLRRSAGSSRPALTR